MQRLIFGASSVFLMTLACVDAKPDRRPVEPKSPPQNVRDLTGIYACSYKGSLEGAGFVRMKIWNQSGKTFQIGIADITGNPGIDWEGRGVIEGDRGYYDWLFPDGKQGRTTFTIDKDGRIHGQVRGGGIDWDYVGRRVEKALLPRMPRP